MTSNLSWPSPPGDWSKTLNSQTDARPRVHVWASSLAVSITTLQYRKQLLSKDELSRAARFRFQLHRNRFIAGRGFLRYLLGGYLETDPASLEFAYGPNGKPALPGAAHASEIEFNLAHSEDLALLAVAKGLPIGVDVEVVRQLSDAGDLVARFFCARENKIFSQLTVAEQPAAFFNLWTRKEALLKATGEGIGRLLNQVEVSFLPNEPAEFKALPAEVAPRSRWTLGTLTPAPGYAGALAAQAKPVDVQCWKWEFPDPKRL